MGWGKFIGTAGLFGAYDAKIYAAHKSGVKFKGRRRIWRLRLTYKAYLIDMEGDSYRLRETLRSNGTDFETVTK